MKILIYIEYFYPHIGGVEQVFLEVGKRLIAKKNEIIVFTTDEPYQTANKIIKKKKTYLAGLLKEYDIKGIRVVRLSLPKFLKRYLFPFIGLPISFMMFGHVDLIHSANNYSVAIPSFLLAKMLQN